MRTVFTSFPTHFFIWLKLWVGICKVSTWKTNERSLQVRRDALSSVGNPDCNKVGVNKDDKCD